MNSIGSSKTDKAPEFYVEASAENTLAPTTIAGSRIESVDIGPPASMPSGYEQCGPSTLGSEPQTSGHSEVQTKESSAKSGEIPGFPQIKANQVQVSARLMLSGYRADRNVASRSMMLSNLSVICFTR
jgi:hypothetical protein